MTDEVHNFVPSWMGCPLSLRNGSYTRKKKRRQKMMIEQLGTSPFDYASFDCNDVT